MSHYLLQERGAADGLLRVQEEVLQQLKFPRGEIETRFLDGNRMAEPVERERP
jgi:hypothetical protein